VSQKARHARSRRGWASAAAADWSMTSCEAASRRPSCRERDAEGDVPGGQEQARGHRGPAAAALDGDAQGGELRRAAVDQARKRERLREREPTVGRERAEGDPDRADGHGHRDRLAHEGIANRTHRPIY